MARDFSRGIFRENPIFVSMLGLCPSLAVTTHVVNALGLGAAVLLVLVLTSLTASLARDVVPPRIRVVVYLGVIAVLVTVVDVLMSAYLPGLRERLGIFVPLIVVNCLILGRAEAFARHNAPGSAVIDALGMGLGFVLSLTGIALVREVLGAGTVTLFPMGSFGGVIRVPGLSDAPLAVTGLAAGAFLVVGYLKALLTWISRVRRGESAQPTRGIREENL